MSPFMCKETNDHPLSSPSLVLSKASNPQMHPQKSSFSLSGTERLSDLSKATQLISRALNTGVLTGNLRLFAMPEYSSEQDFSVCGLRLI